VNSVQLGIKLAESAQAAIMGTISVRELAASHSHIQIQLIKAVLHGIGKIVSVSNAQTIGYSTTRKYVFRFPVNAILSIIAEPA
jgi:uncharacterized protein (DUF697 family)